ncbi:MAG: four helix bundle protein [Bacteroidota bacterium]
MEENKSIRSFTDLDTWQRCRDLAKQVWILCQKLPPDEKYRLSDQLIRCSRSSTANIAEGYGRFNFQENIHFCRIARGSLHELLNHLICANDCNLINEKEFQQLQNDVEKCIHILNGYLRYLTSAKKNWGNTANEDQEPYLTEEKHD